MVLSYFLWNWIPPLSKNYYSYHKIFVYGLVLSLFHGIFVYVWGAYIELNNIANAFQLDCYTSQVTDKYILVHSHNIVRFFLGDKLMYILI